MDAARCHSDSDRGLGGHGKAYTLTVYDSTWGTWADYLSAFAAGFLGKVVVDWGDQFISRSFRVPGSVAEAASKVKAGS